MSTVQAPQQAYKVCPACSQPAVLDMPACGRCGRSYHTPLHGRVLSVHNAPPVTGARKVTAISKALVILAAVLVIALGSFGYRRIRAQAAAPTLTTEVLNVHDILDAPWKYDGQVISVLGEIKHAGGGPPFDHDISDVDRKQHGSIWVYNYSKSDNWEEESGVVLVATGRFDGKERSIRATCFSVPSERQIAYLHSFDARDMAEERENARQMAADEVQRERERVQYEIEAKARQAEPSPAEVRGAKDVAESKARDEYNHRKYGIPYE